MTRSTAALATRLMRSITARTGAVIGGVGSATPAKPSLL